MYLWSCRNQSSSDDLTIASSFAFLHDNSKSRESFGIFEFVIPRVALPTSQDNGPVRPTTTVFRQRQKRWLGTRFCTTFDPSFAILLSFRRVYLYLCSLSPVRFFFSCVAKTTRLGAFSFTSLSLFLDESSRLSFTITGRRLSSTSISLFQRRFILHRH